MNRTILKNYAPQARRQFIQAMKDRAAFCGLTAKMVEPIVERGDVAVIGGREHPRAIAGKRKLLEARIKKYGYEQTMEAMAYTWFNRLVAIRFMELHGYLDHGYRVLSHPEGKPTPEILEHAVHVDFPGLRKETVIDLKLAGNKEGELYRLLLTAQCNALHTAMPFLFERIDDETELLLPDNLLHSDSLIRTLVGEIPEEDWQQVEIIGWLYQFYISERKDEVMGKVVASEDIPAATQLFTPNWIVKYLVQNTLGRQWLATYPTSALREHVQYYVEPAKQAAEVQEKLKTTARTSLNPEELTLLDPACGSGHILVEAYDLFKVIYQERGYRAKDIPALILQKNLFGLEIDDRAAQLAGFALMMKARADDRRIFDSEAKPNILAIEGSEGMNASDITHALNSPISKEDFPNEYLFEEIQEDKDGLFSKGAMAEKGHVSQNAIASLLELFENAKTFGSLVPVPPGVAETLPAIEGRLATISAHGDLTHTPALIIRPLVKQAELLRKKYEVVVANPPYMGSGYFNGVLKRFVDDEFRGASGDLYAAFIARGLDFLGPHGVLALITIPTWLFLPTYEALRARILNSRTLECLVDNGRGIFGPDFGSCAFVIHGALVRGYRGQFVGLKINPTSVPSLEELERRFHIATRQQRTAEDFLAVPGYAISPYIPEQMLTLFKEPALDQLADVRQGVKTGEIKLFLRYWHEVSYDKIFFNCRTREESEKDDRRWYPCNKGGEFRKWFGNLDYVINWQHDGHAIRTFVGPNGRLRSRPQNLSYFFRQGITWSTVVTMGKAAFRFSPPGRAFESGGSTIFLKDEKDTALILGLLNSAVAGSLIEVLSPKVSLAARG